MSKTVCITTKQYHYYELPDDMSDEKAVEEAERKFSEDVEPDDYKEAGTQVEIV